MDDSTAASASHLDSRKEALMEWVLTAQSERELTFEQLAEKIGVSKWTLRDWRREESFKAEQEKRAKEIAGGVEKTMMLLRTLEKQWMDSESPKQIQAAKLWADITGAIAPRKTETTRTTKSDLKDMPIEELRRLAALAANDELARRRDKAV